MKRAALSRALFDGPFGNHRVVRSGCSPLSERSHRPSRRTKAQNNRPNRRECCRGRKLEVFLATITLFRKDESGGRNEQSSGTTEMLVAEVFRLNFGRTFLF